MAKLLTSHVLWAATILMGGYWVVALTVDYAAVAEILNAMRFIMALLVVFAYLPVAYEAMTLPSREMTHVHQLVLGICLSWAVQIFNSSFGIAGQFFDFQVALRENMVTGAAAWCTILAAVLHLSAPKALEHASPVRSWATVGFGMLAGIVIGFILASAWWKAQFP